MFDALRFQVRPQFVIFISSRALWFSSFKFLSCRCSQQGPPSVFEMFPHQDIRSSEFHIECGNKCRSIQINPLVFDFVEQFVETGCENCDFLSMENISERVLEVSLSHFSQKFLGGSKRWRFRADKNSFPFWQTSYSWLTVHHIIFRGSNSDSWTKRLMGSKVATYRWEMHLSTFVAVFWLF